MLVQSYQKLVILTVCHKNFHWWPLKISKLSLMYFISNNCRYFFIVGLTFFCKHIVPGGHGFCRKKEEIWRWRVFLQRSKAKIRANASLPDHNKNFSHH